MDQFSDQKIVDSWHKNTQPWVAAVRDGEIESRVLVTNEAIVETILAQAPKTVLDVGCGEGWLVRALAEYGILAWGVDVVPEFIAIAQKAGGGTFKCLSYEALSHNTIEEKFDLVVCNFSLIGKESVETLCNKIPALLHPGGRFLVQTIHPITASAGIYEDGWRAGSWDGFSDQFSDPAPWYFRTIESWKQLFLESSFNFLDIIEPVNPKTGKVASMIFVGRL